MRSQKKKPNYFRINNPIVNKLFLWLLSTGAIVDATMLLSLLANEISELVWGEGAGISHLFGGFYRYMDFLLVLLLVLFMAISIIVLYTYLSYMQEHRGKEETAKAESPLQGAAVEHEEQIIDLLMIIAKPLPGRAKLNRARTAQFLRALIELGYIDKNTAGRTLMAWVETVTEYKDGNASHFQQAIKDATPQDSNVLEFQNQIQQIVGE